MWNRSMRSRLVLSFVGVVLIAIFSLVFFIRQDTNRQVRVFMSRGGMVGLDSLVQRLERFYRNNGNSWDGVSGLVALPSQGSGMGMGMDGSQAMRSRMIRRLRLADDSGLVIGDTLAAGIVEKLTESELQQAIVLQSRQQQTIGYLFAEGAVVFTNAEEQLLIRSINQAVLRAGLLSVGIGLFLALLLSGEILRPVQQLTRAVQRLGQGDRSHRVSVEGQDEISKLGRTFNQMADTLEQSDTRRKAMTADIAHELNTPLAVQRAHLEALQDGIYPLQVENLAPVLEQNHLLTRLVEDLRTLALVDAGELHLDFVAVDMIDLARGLISQFRPAAERLGIRLELEAPESMGEVVVQGDADRLAQIVNNLLSNALRHTPQGGVVRLVVQAVDQKANLKVSDSGSGIAEEDLPNIFERFYRSDKSRSRSEGGSGLGLAIARQLAVAQGGSLRAANQPQGGAQFILELPLARS